MKSELNLALLAEHTNSLVAAGHKVFQIHRFAAGEASHVSRLLRWAEFPQGARVCDMGCGTGEVARLMQEERPDLAFCLVNLSEAQLQYAPAGMAQHIADFCTVPEADGAFDAVMFCFSIGHAALDDALREAARLVRAGGVLFIYDMIRVGGDNESMREVSYEVAPRGEVEAVAEAYGFSLDVYLEPRDRGGYGRSVLGDAFEAVFSGTRPAIWRFISGV